MNESNYPAYRLFGRRQDRPLKPRQQRLLHEFLPELAVTDALLSDLKQQGQPVWAELGFGGGEHLVWQAAQNPDVMFLGAEPFINGVAKLLTQIDDLKLNNIRILHGDGRPMLEKLPQHSLERLFILHPDPWPKKKHHKRRLVSADLLAQVARLLSTGGELRIASDIPDYIRWTLLHIQLHNRQSRDFVWLAESMSDWKDRPKDWPQTRYEAKAIREGRRSTYLKFQRR